MAGEKEIRLAGAILGGGHHVCAFFNDEDEKYSVLTPFIREGLAQGHRVIQVVAIEDRERQLARTRREGTDVATAIDDGRIEVRSWRESVPPPVDADTSVQVVRRILEEGRARGFPLTRLIGDMAWALEALHGMREVLRYEAQLDEVLADYRDPVVCCYDTSRFPGSAIIDAIRTHPVVIIGGVLHENPFHVAPAEFLRQLGSQSN